MGQSESKLKGSFTFAYLANSGIPTNNITSTTAPIEEEEEDLFENDQILRNPELYGLRTLQQYPFLPQGSSSLTSLDSLPQPLKYHHRDSGYISPYYDESLKLANDLSYIDNTYYNNNRNTAITAATTATTTTMTDDQQQINEGCSGAQITFTDVMLASPDKTIREVYLSCRSIHKLSPNMGMLTMIRKLDLSNNHLTELPESIGYIQSLETLSLSKNRLKLIPDTIGYLSNLVDLDISYNEIQQITPCISYLNKLKNLSLAFNQITYLPTDVSGLVSLISLDLTRNPLRVLPAEISQLAFLRRMRLDDCPFQSDLEYPLKHDPPSLLEICARTVTRTNTKIDNNKLPDHMINYIKSAKSCTSCHGPYYESFVLRGRLMEKTDMHIPLEYTLCSAHWSDADDRILSMFSAQPSTSSQVIHQPYRPNLPFPPKLATERLSALTTARSRRLQSIPPTESNVTIDTSALLVDDNISASNNNQLVPAATTTTTKFLNQNQLNKSKLVVNLTSRLKRPW